MKESENIDYGPSAIADMYKASTDMTTSVLNFPKCVRHS